MRSPDPDDLPGDFAARLAAPTATPGGGAAAARVAVYAASLLRMVLGITIAKSKDGDVVDRLQPLDAAAEGLAGQFSDIEKRDVRGFQRFMEALTLPRGNEAEKLARKAARRDAAQECVAVPLELLRGVHGLFELAERVREEGARSPLKAASDLAVARELALAAFRCADHTLAANFSELAAEEVEVLRTEVGALRADVERLYGVVGDW